MPSKKMRLVSFIYSYHQVVDEQKTNMSNDEKIMNQLTKFYQMHTKIPPKFLEECMKKDIYISYDECVKYKIQCNEP